MIAAREGGVGWAKTMIDLYEKGASDVEICGALKISEKEFKKKIVEDELFNRLVTIGRLHAKAWWYTQARINLSDRNFNASLYRDVMRNRYGWSDGRTESSETKPEAQMSEEERMSEISSLLARLGKRAQSDPNINMAELVSRRA